MSDEGVSYDLGEIHDLLLAAFGAEELDSLFLYTENPDLKHVRGEYAPGDGLGARVDKTVDYCQRRGLLADLLAEVERARPQIRAEAALPELDPEEVAAYLAVVRNQCGRVETRPYRQLSELRGAPPRLTLLAEEGQAGVYQPLRFDLHPSRAGHILTPTLGYETLLQTDRR